MAAKNIYFCVFCPHWWTEVDRFDPSRRLRDHMTAHHLTDRTVDESTIDWINSLATYERDVNRSLRDSPSGLPKTEVPELATHLMRGCPLCDCIIQYFKLDLNTRYPQSADGRHRQRQRSLCVCGSGREDPKVIVTCHQCQQLLHYDCVEPYAYSGEDISLYKCFRCRAKTSTYEILDLKRDGGSEFKQKVHLYHHLKYLPFVCKAPKVVADGCQSLCNKSFSLLNLLRGHIKTGHNLSLDDNQLSHYIKRKEINEVNQLINKCFVKNTTQQSNNTSPANTVTVNTHQTSASSRPSLANTSSSATRYVVTNTGLAKSSTTQYTNVSSPPLLTPVSPERRAPPTAANQSSNKSCDNRPNMNEMYNRVNGGANRSSTSHESHNNSAKRVNINGTPPVLTAAHQTLINHSKMATNSPSGGIVANTQQEPTRKRRGRPPRLSKTSPKKPHVSPVQASIAATIAASRSDNNLVVRQPIAPNGHITEGNPLMRSRLSKISRLSRPDISLSREDERTRQMTANTTAEGNDEDTGWDSDVGQYERNSPSKKSRKTATKTAIPTTNNSPVANGRASNNDSQRASAGQSAESDALVSRPTVQTPDTVIVSPDIAVSLPPVAASVDSATNGDQTNGLSGAGDANSRPSTSRLTDASDVITSEVNVSAAGGQPAPVHHSPSDWLLHTTPKKFPYYPQKGDEVVYIPYGNQLYNNQVKTLNLYKQTNHNKYLKEKDIIVAKIREIKFEKSANVRLARLTLAVITNGVESNNTFTIKYTDLDGVIDFIILKQLYDRSQHIEWSINQTFRSIVEDKWWFGTIHNFNINDNNMVSQFQSIQVEWANHEVENLSYWDLDRVPKGMVPKNRGSSLEVTDADRREFYVPEVKEWPELGKRLECDRISIGLTQAMNLSEWIKLAETFDHKNFYYANTVAYPVDLNIIKARVDSGFYRRHSSIKYDIKFIESNAIELTNGHKNEMLINARIVVSVCLRFIDDKTARNIDEIHKKVINDLPQLDKIKFYSCVRPYLNPNPNTMGPSILETINNMINANSVDPSNEIPEQPSVIAVAINNSNDFEIVDMTMTSDEESVQEASDDDEDVKVSVKREPRRSNESNRSLTPQEAKLTIRRYFCILCDETFTDRNEVVDHYCDEFKVKLRCDHCPQNQRFDSMDDFVAHNERHALMVKQSFNQREYAIHKAWIDQMVKYSDGLVTELNVQNSIHELYGDWCPVCKRLNLLTGNGQPLYNDRVFANKRRNLKVHEFVAERDFKHHLKDHLKYELIYECSLCPKLSGGDQTSLGADTKGATAGQPFRSPSLTACRRHLIAEHKVNQSVDDSQVVSYLQNSRIPRLDKMINTLVNRFIVAFAANL